MLTGIQNRALLIASHIKPWAEFKEDRMNPENGLILSPMYDKLFDRFLMSFNSQGEIQLSESVKRDSALMDKIDTKRHVIEVRSSGQRINL